jgi:hypothetical protein
MLLLSICNRDQCVARGNAYTVSVDPATAKDLDRTSSHSPWVSATQANATRAIRANAAVFMVTGCGAESREQRAGVCSGGRAEGGYLGGAETTLYTPRTSCRWVYVAHPLILRLRP